jgi:peptide/nickel transport system permease protein
MLPIITMTGTEFAKLIGGAIVVENVFAIPGLGSRVIIAINQKDIPTVLCCVLFLSLFFIIATLIMDILYTFVDPRVKSSIMGSGKSRRKKAGEEAA